MCPKLSDVIPFSSDTHACQMAVVMDCIYVHKYVKDIIPLVTHTLQTADVSILQCVWLNMEILTFCLQDPHNILIVQPL